MTDDNQKEKNLIVCYRKENLILTDKLEVLKDNFKELQVEYGKLEDNIKDLIEKRNYWKVKAERNNSYFRYFY